MHFEVIRRDVLNGSSRPKRPQPSFVPRAAFAMRRPRMGMLLPRPMVAATETRTFRSLRILDPNTGRDEVGNATIEDGRLRFVGHSTEPLSRTIDATGWIGAPAFIDLRARFFEPGLEYREGFSSGLLAAAAGGYGWAAAMPCSAPATDEGALFSSVLERARGKKGARVLPLGALTRKLKGKELADLGELAEAGAVAVTDVSTSHASSELLRRAFEYAATFGLTVFQHPGDIAMEEGTMAHEGVLAERLGLRGHSPATELIGLVRDLELAALTGVHYHASVLSTAAAVEVIRRAKQNGQRVTADVAAHQLLLTDEALANYDPLMRVDPPLRSEEHRRALVAGVMDGTIDAIVSDHTPLSRNEKDCEFDQALPGISSLETTLPVLAELVRRGELTWQVALQALTTGPARVLGLAAPALRADEPASLTVFAPDEAWIPSQDGWRSRQRNTPFYERQLRGRVRFTYVEGELIFEQGAKSAIAC